METTTTTTTDKQLELMSPPPPADGREAKRARKRSRYLSPPYTDKHVHEDVAAADVLSALRAAALLGQDPSAAQALRFLALFYRRRRRTTTTFTSFANLLPDSAASHRDEGAVLAAGVLSLSSARPAMPVPHDGSPAPGSAALGTNKKKNPQAAAAAATISNQDKTAAALGEADLAVNVTNGVSNSAPPKSKSKSKSNSNSNSNSKSKSKSNSNSKSNNKDAGQDQHFQNPVALVLDFAEGTPLPSKHQLLSTFHKFGFVIHSETAVAKDQRCARVVFAARAQAEAAYQTLGAFGPPFATARLHHLPPIRLNAFPKLPLTDIRNNLEKMISSLTSGSSSPEAANPKPPVGNLVEEMQGLLAKVDKMLQGASSTAHRH